MDPEFLVGSELGVSGEKGQFAANFILDAFFGVAFVKRFVVVPQHFQVVFTAADVAGEGGNGNFGFDVAGPNNDGFNDHQRSDVLSSEVGDSFGLYFGVGAVDDSDIIVLVRGDGYKFIFFQHCRILQVQIVLPLLPENILELESEFLS